MEKKDNDVLHIIATIIIVLMGSLLWYQNKTIKDYQEIKTDTITFADTIYLDKVIKDTVPTVQYKKEIIRDTLWHSNGDSIFGEPQIITLVKKKSVIPKFKATIQ